MALPPRVTIKDVAAVAGVSVGSVSHVLTGSPKASQKLVLKVRKAVEELGYEPDSVAQSMRSRSTSTIGMMLADISNPIYAELANAVEERLRAAGYLVVLSSTRNEEVQELSMLSTIRRRRMDGLIVLAGAETNVAVNEAIATLGVPTVMIDREVPEGDAVCVDHRGGATMAMRYLIGLGHRRIALLVPSEEIRPGRERAAGYRQSLLDAGIDADESLVRIQKASTSFAYSETTTLLGTGPRPSAIIALGTHMLAGVLKGIEACGLRIPTDVSVISVGDTDLTKCATPAITSLRWDVAEVGRTAAEMLLDRIAKKPVDGIRRVALPVELVVRGSCASPSQ